MYGVRVQITGRRRVVYCHKCEQPNVPGVAVRLDHLGPSGYLEIWLCEQCLRDALALTEAAQAPAVRAAGAE